MVKVRNIVHQLIYAVDSSTAFGESKRSQKKEGNGMDHKIYSVSYMKDLRATAKELGRFLKETYPDIRLIKNVNCFMLQKFIDSKAECSEETVKKYISHMNKLEKCVTRCYGKTDWHMEHIRVPDGCSTQKRKNLVMEERIYKMLLTKLESMRGETWKALVLGWCAGLRVNEAREVKMGCLTEKGGLWGCGTLTLSGKADGCKGGRPRVIDILSPEDFTELKRVVEGVKPGMNIVSNHGREYARGSLLANMRNAMKDLNIPDMKWNRQHSARKAFAQRSYDCMRTSGADQKESKIYVNRQLGHGRNRDELLKAYSVNCW